MILRKITLHPFAGFTSQELQLSAGLNIVYGPNDIGKSTLFRAIEAVLFYPIRPRANSIEGKELKRFIPIGGDHARVRLDFEKNDLPYQLEKVWGPDPASKLKLPGGTTLSAPDQIEEKLKNLLPSSAPSFRSILLTTHSALQRTVVDLIENPSVSQSLGDALRLSLHQSDGLSIDIFKSSLNKETEETFLNWDFTNQSPKKGRGIENPWERQGKILRSYYKKETLRKLLREVRSMEADLGEKNTILTEKLYLQTQLRNYIQLHKNKIESISARQNLQLKYDQNLRDTLTLTQDFHAWVQSEADRKTLEPEMKRLETLCESLTHELKEARIEIEQRDYIARFKKLEAAKKTLEDFQNQQKQIKPVLTNDVASLQKIASAIDRLKISLSSSKLQIHFLPKKDLELKITKDLEPEKQEFLASLTPLLLRAGGKISISSESFDLTVTSGDGKIEQIEADLKKLSEDLTQNLNRIGVGSLEEAKTLHEKWTQNAQATRNAEIAFHTLLSGENYPTLFQKFLSVKPTHTMRDPELIEKDLQATQQQFIARKTDFAACSRLIEQHQRRYSVLDSAQLTQFLIQKGVEKKILQTELSLLPAVPEGAEELKNYVNRFRESEEKLHPLSDEIRDLTRVITEIKARLPEQSAETLAQSFRESATEFERELNRGQSLLRISEVTEQIESGKTDIFAQFRKKVEDSIYNFTRGKYSKSDFSESIPQNLIRQDGAPIPFAWLSAGTQDAFAMALRLSMANFLLGESKGFVLMDDPMVAMDPQKQKIIADFLRQFSEKIQLIIFTCHPSHAQTLGGNQINLLPATNS